MRRQPFFYALWSGNNFLLVTSLMLSAYGIAWENSTRKYLKGFADAVVPSPASPEHKVEAILAWMKDGPSRWTTASTESVGSRDPEISLNFQKLLRVCGTATNAFVNLGQSSGLESRRLLLLDGNGNTKHVVAEVRLQRRWVVVDPLVPSSVSRRGGPHVGPGATGGPYGSSVLRRILDRLVPGWEEAVNWTLLVERRSFAWAITALLLVCFSFLDLFGLGWYREHAV